MTRTAKLWIVQHKNALNVLLDITMTDKNALLSILYVGILKLWQENVLHAIKVILNRKDSVRYNSKDQYRIVRYNKTPYAWLVQIFTILMRVENVLKEILYVRLSTPQTETANHVILVMLSTGLIVSSLKTGKLITVRNYWIWHIVKCVMMDFC